MRWAPLALVWGLAACGSDGETSPSVSDVPDVVADVAPDTAPDAIAPPECPNGHILGADGECMAVGIQGCDDMFINPETGLCEPSPDHCPPGQIPIFSGDDQGCRPVGILDCAPEFIDAETGLCDPDPDFCGPGYIPVPTQGCVSLDPPGGCGEGTWGGLEDLPGDVHVDMSYTGGDSDGSRDKPWTLIAYALGKVQPGGRVVLAAGVYEEGVLLSKSFTLIGRCGSMVTLGGVRAGPTGPTVLEAKGNVDVAVKDLRVSGPGLGLIAYSGVRVSLERVALDGNTDMGLVVLQSGTSVTATDCLVARTASLEDGTHGRGAQISDKGTLSLERVAFMENHEFGFLAAETGTTVHATDTIIARTQPRDGELAGWGAQVRDGAHAVLERVVLWENHAVGLMASGAGTMVTATESLVIRTQVRTHGTGGRGVEVESGTTLSLDRTALVENGEVGLAVFDPGTSVTVTDTLVSRTQPWEDGTAGRAMQVKDGGSLTVTRATLVENHDASLVAIGSGTTLTVTGSLITATQPGLAGNWGHGIGVQGGASFSLMGSALTDNRDVGLVLLKQNTPGTISEVWISRTQPREDGLRGIGLGLESLSGIVIERVALTHNHQSALYLNASEASVTDALLIHTSLDGESIGDGMIVNLSSVTATGIIARGNARAGVIFNQGSGALNESLVTENAIGLVVQGETHPLVGESTIIAGNDEDSQGANTLVVPNEPLSLPDLPELDE